MPGIVAPFSSTRRPHHHHLLSLSRSRPSLSLHLATPCADPSQRQPPSPISLLFISLTPANRRPSSSTRRPHHHHLLSLSRSRPSLSLHFSTPCANPSQRQPPSPVSLLFISLTPADGRPSFLHAQTAPPSPPLPLSISAFSLSLSLSLSLSPFRNPLRRPISEAAPNSNLSALHLSHACGPLPLLPPRADRTTITSDAEPHHLSLFSLHAQNSSHSQAAAARLPPLEEIHTLLDRSTRGMLSTFSQKHEGYPSGSMVDFACDHDGVPILAVSSLAVHTKDLLANPKCSLLVAKDPEDRTDLVITLHGDAISVAESNRVAVRTAYLRRHPNAFWVDFGDFQFMRIEPKVVRYVSGVATALLGSGEFGIDEYKAAKVDLINQFSAPVASHMNKDHAEDTKAIVQHSTSVQVDFAHMLDLDSLGFYVKAGYQGNTLKLRIPFPRQAEDRKDVKSLIVEMLQAAKASGRAT